MVFIGSPIADVVQMNVDQSVLDGTLQDADLKIRLKNGWEESEDIKTHKCILVLSGLKGKRNKD